MRPAQLAEIYDVYERGSFDRARELVEAYLEYRCEDGRAWELKGLIHLAQGEDSQSVAALERASLLVPLSSAGQVCLGHGYGRIGRRSLSRDLLVDLIDNETLEIELLLQVGTALDAIGHPALAMRACRRATQRDPDVAQAYYDMGYYAARCGYPLSVTESLARRAIFLDPDRVSYRVGLASLLVRNGRRREAHELMRHFSNDQIAAIDCRPCLERIVELFESVHDYRRVILCQQRLLELEIGGEESRDV